MASKVGDGSRFKSFVKQVVGQGASPQAAAAIAASAGRKKYGSKRFSKMSAAGKKK